VTPDLYALLDLPRTADFADIKTAFRSKAKAGHPDLGGDPELFHLFKLAYDVLTDDEARRHYDETGETPAERAANEAEEARFRVLVGDLMMTMISQGASPTFTNVLEELGRTVALQVHAADQQLLGLAELSARLQQVLARLHSHEQGEDYLITLMRQRYVEMETKTKVTQDLRTRLIRLQQRLAHYSYDVQIDSIV
jgi:curved DNA-binding protein CbpA